MSELRLPVAQMAGQMPGLRFLELFCGRIGIPCNGAPGPFHSHFRTRLPPQSIVSVETSEEGRVRTEVSEFDRVLGGGLVIGSVVLIGGDPGIGKSTLLLQALDRLARKKINVLYVSGEESLRQTKMRGDRIGITSPDLYVLAENSLEKIMEYIQKLKPKVAVIDSIQTVFTSQLQSAPGSIGQVRESAGKLMVLSKSTGLSTFLIGHVTKEGAIAGPRVLEHIVDTVLYFEGDRGHPYRILRAVKNRFGSTNEIGVFEMKDGGLEEVANPSELFLAERPIDVPGSVVISSIEGSRPILVELQALVSSVFLWDAPAHGHRRGCQPGFPAGGGPGEESGDEPGPAGYLRERRRGRPD